MESTFRFALITNILLSILFWCLPYIDYLWLTAEEMILLDQGGLGSVLPHSELWYWSSLIIWITTSIGMYFYNELARKIFVVMQLLTYTLSLFYGIQVLSVLESALSGLITLLDGAILTMAYLTALGGKFEKNS